MTAKEYMKLTRVLLRRINRKQKEAETLRQELSVRQSSGSLDMSKELSAEIISLEKEIRVAEKELKNLKSDFQAAISVITDTEYHDILTKRYLEFKDWSTIAKEMGYSEPSCYRLHREALALIKS